MLTKRNSHKPSDAFVRDFQRKFSTVAAIPYTFGAGIVPVQLVQGNINLSGLVSNPTLLPSPSYSSPAPTQLNCTCPLPLGPAYILPHNTHGFQDDSQFDQPSPMDETQTEKLRFEVTLHAPTATYNPTRQIPTTYLNRGQAYKLSIIDTAPPTTSPRPVRYRTHVRIAFDSEEQRADPKTSWRLWSKSRGLHEASNRGDGQLRAVEIVEQSPGSQVALESSSLDGFSIEWISDPQSGHVGCEARIVFNFLSTDFTLSKGVRGVPLRLYAKTSAHPAPSSPEICYCKVKLFRDHGSERKLSNDALQLKKAIGKVHQQLEALQPGATQSSSNPGKRKRGPCLATTHVLSASDELQDVLSDLKAVLASSNPKSTLSLRGDTEDDPDRFPIVLSDPLHDSPLLDSKSIKTEPEEPLPAAVTCFYILRRLNGKIEDYYHAIYLHKPTLSDLLYHLAQTYQMGANEISHAIRVNAAGLHILVDDDVIREIPNGQDMIADFDQDAGRIRATLFY